MDPIDLQIDPKWPRRFSKDRAPIIPIPASFDHLWFLDLAVEILWHASYPQTGPKLVSPC